MKKQYLSAPLPFQGQKRMFAKEYIKVLQQFPDSTTFVDLFGGSGLLSHIAKFQKPNSTVVYNDFDGYRLRLEHIPQTNALLSSSPAFCAIIQERKPLQAPCVGASFPAYTSMSTLSVMSIISLCQARSCFR